MAHGFDAPDRDLTVAGSVIVKTAEGGGFERRLLHCKKPILRVPNLAIHLQTPAERQTFTINKETHLTPILGIDLAILAEEQLNGDAAPADDRHSPAFLTLIAKELGCAVGDIQDFDLTLCDTQPAACWGMFKAYLGAEDEKFGKQEPTLADLIQLVIEGAGGVIDTTNWVAYHVSLHLVVV